jgi:hypothetical protein
MRRTSISRLCPRVRICIALRVMLQYRLRVKTSRLRSVRGADQGGGIVLAEAILPNGPPTAKVRRAFVIQGEDVGAEARGYDLLSRSPDGDVRYIEVKGRAGVGAVEIFENEWLKAEQLGEGYWLYIVTDALQAPALYLVQDPARKLPLEEVIPQVRYRVAQKGWKQVAESTVGYKVSAGRAQRLS